MAAATNATLVGVFDDPIEAEGAVEDLQQVGYESADVEMVIRGEEAVRGGEITDALGTKDMPDAWRGIVIGGLAGMLLGSLSGFMFHDAMHYMRDLGAIAGYAGAGMAVGGLLGAMYGLLRSEREARHYAHAFATGRAIVAVPADQRVNGAVDILKRHHGHDIHQEPCDPLHPEQAPWRLLFKGP